MRPRGKTPISSGSIGRSIGVPIAIVVVVAIMAFLGAPRLALAQNPAPSAISTKSGSAPNSVASSGARAGASSPVSTSLSAKPTSNAAPHPASASGAEAARQAPDSPTDPQTVISYLSDVIGWYRHLGVEAQLVVEPTEMLFFASDRQVANEILQLAFEYAHAQANFIAQTTGRTTIKATEKPGGAAISAAIATPIPSGTGTDLRQKFEQLQTAAIALQTRLNDLQARLAKAPARD